MCNKLVCTTSVNVKQVQALWEDQEQAQDQDQEKIRARSRKRRYKIQQQLGQEQSKLRWKKVFYQLTYLLTACAWELNSLWEES